ncbi:MAG: hypothetical protein JF591_04055 [Lysobacter sp.]|nr:hypothetical protein [Lysobacter sp.]
MASGTNPSDPKSADPQPVQTGSPDPRTQPVQPDRNGPDQNQPEQAPPQYVQPGDTQPRQGAGRAQVGAPVGAGPFGQFIVKYRDGTGPLTQQGAVQPRLDQTAQRAGLANKSGLKLTWKHRMGIQADVFSVSPALDRADAVRLMETFADDPDVQFIEPDNHIALDPIIRGPAVIDK